MGEQTAPSYSLVVPTKDRSYHLSRRLPLWAGMGYDEVIVVDSSGDHSHRETNEQLCARLGVQYLYVRANRSEARNLGARVATGSWVFFTDDDVAVPATLHRTRMDARATKYDWLKAAVRDEVTIFNREFFHRIGGYRPNLVFGEDDDLTARAFAQGRGGPVEGVFGEIGYTPNESEVRLDFKRRLSNYIEYSLTIWEYAKSTARPAKTMFSWCLEVLRTGRRALRGDLRALPYFLGAVGGIGFGLLMTPLRQPARRGIAGASPRT